MHIFLNLVLLWCTSMIFAQSAEVSIIDTRHYSNVFGEIRNYRIFLPPGYHQEADKKYPVIYYYHGWSQRYFGETYNEYAGIDQGTDNNGDNISNFVSSHEVIVVKPDGYNRSPQQEYYLRPYNISPVETSRQFPLYFPELVAHIDATYRTIADRSHRGISGLSMGGFMTFWIAGKYPQLVSAAGNFCGSPEFFVGPRNFPVEYKHMDMYKNYGGLDVRLHYGDKDFIRGYHQDLNRTWPQLMDNYQFKIFDAEHTPCGLAEMFQSILTTFDHPPAQPERWHHIDVYPAFEVWGYQVQSDRDLPGFTVLENVDKLGFRCAVREFLPNGPLMTQVHLSITTSPIYAPSQPYTITDFNPTTNTNSVSTIESDQLGRLKFTLDGGRHDIGIALSGQAPNLSLASYKLLNTGWAQKDQPVSVAVNLVNKGNGQATNLTASLTPLRTTATVKPGQVTIPDIPAGEIMEIAEPFVFEVKGDSSIDVVQFKLEITDADDRQWVEFLDIPVHPEVLPIDDFVIADGREFKVANAGDDTTSMVLGHGNGDGMVNPGESFVILVPHNDIYYRTQLYFNHPGLNPDGINLRESDNWGSYDHVGGSAKYSIPVVAADCPEGSQIKLLAEYWLPDYPYHIIKKGEINLTVSGHDQTPPVVRWVNIRGDNTLQIRLYDGGAIGAVTARLVNTKSPDQVIEVTLNDQGRSSDRVSGDRIFSYQIPHQQFGLYQIQITAADLSGNSTTKNWPGNFVVH
ncbi:MAG: hypothetical protein DHS20C17_17590 [Cyclobacteriaceae bacterium]|nr:MAG: hypothetical protein DHS20C17_17590 [Cyclobacteriaceae bacterium]